MKSKVFVKKISDFPSIKLIDPSRTVKIILDKEIGAENISAGVCIIDPLSKIPYHSHEKEEEFMYIINGKGKLITEEGNYELSDDSIIFVKPNVKHTIVNELNEPLYFLFVYSPPGPEQKTKQMIKNSVK
jgi:mannose-6-phosphate isomerase-like protein (cupin superfamily)